MFEAAELGHEIPKAEYEKEVPLLRAGLLQAQRDLTTQLNNELASIISYNRALINFEAVQVVPPGGGS